MLSQRPIKEDLREEKLIKITAFRIGRDFRKLLKLYFYFQ